MTATPETVSPTRGRTDAAWVHSPLVQSIAAFLAFNVVFALGGLWYRIWYLGAAIEFGLVAWMAQSLRITVPERYGGLLERSLTVVFPFLVLVGWELIVRAEILNPQWFPAPSTIVAALWDMSVHVDPNTDTSLLGRPWLIPRVAMAEGWEGVRGLYAESHLYTTVRRVLLGFAIGSVPGIIVGAAMGANRTVRLMLDNVMSAVYVLPKIAIFPVVMLIFADPFGEGPKVAVVAISAFFLVAFNTMAGVENIEPIYTDVGRNYGASRWQTFRHIILPGALPVIFAGLRIALGTALIVVIAIEFVRANQGVGYLTLYYWKVLEPPKMYASLLVTMILGVLLTYGLAAVERRVIPWRRESVSGDQ